MVRWPKPAALPQARVPYQARRLVIPQHRQPVAGPGVPGRFSHLAHVSGPDGKRWIGHVEERRGLVNCDLPPLLPPACLPSVPETSGWPPVSMPPGERPARLGSPCSIRLTPPTRWPAVLPAWGYLIWRWLRDGSPVFVGVLGAITLVLYGVVPTLQKSNDFGRIYAAYGGVFVVASLQCGSVQARARPA